MNSTFLELRSAEAVAYGGLIDAIGGIATAVLAIVALTGFAPEAMVGVATIVFGAALLIQGGALLSEYAHFATVPTGAEVASSAETFGADGLAAMFLVGAGGIVLGVLVLLSITSVALAAIAVIAYGSALVLSSSAVRHLYLLQATTRRVTGSRSGNEFLAGEMASGSAGIQLLSGLAAIVLGVLAISGVNSLALTLTALLVLGVTVMLTGSTLSGLVLSFMRPQHTT